MSYLPNAWARYLQAGIVILCAGLGASAMAQEGDDDADAIPVQNQTGWTLDNFDQWVFNGSGNATTVRAKLEILLKLQIDDVDRGCALNEVQKRKLMLAGRGDIKKLFDRVDDQKRKFQLVMNDQNKIGEVFQELQPLQLLFQSGCFDEGSLYSKTISRTLDKDQNTKFAKLLQERMLYRYRARVEMTVAMLDTVVAFRADQRQKLEDVILAETRPPKKFGNYDFYIVTYQLSKIPEEKLKGFLEPTQWKSLNHQLQQGKAMEQWIVDGGYLDKIATAPAPDPKAAPVEIPKTSNQ